MPKFIITAISTMTIRCEVEADTEEEALYIAKEKRAFPSAKEKDITPAHWQIWPRRQGRSTMSNVKVESVEPTEKIDAS